MSPNPAASNASAGRRMPAGRFVALSRHLRAPAFALFVFVAGAGCTPSGQTGSIVVYCDGAGWYTGAARVHHGLEDANFGGTFETFPWSTLLGPGTDHLIAGSAAVTKRLAHRIEKIHRDNPRARIDLMGLSAGTAVVLGAIERLPANVQVRHVVLLSSSASAHRDLTPIMRHVLGYLYNTTSKNDAILSAIAVNADGGDGAPAGELGFRLPRRASPGRTAAYRRVVNLPWNPTYLAYDWDGGHVSATSPAFIRSVIAPRLKSVGPFPIDRQVVRSRATE